MTVHKNRYMSVLERQFWLMFSMCLSSLCVYLESFQKKDGNHGKSCSRCRSDQRYSSTFSGKNRLHGVSYMAWLIVAGFFFHRVTGVGTFRWPLVHGYGPAIDHIFVPSQGRYKLRDSRNLLPHPKYFWQCTHELWKHGLSCRCLMWMLAQWTTLKLVIRLNCVNRCMHFIFTILRYLFIYWVS